MATRDTHFIDFQASCSVGTSETDERPDYAFTMVAAKARSRQDQNTFWVYLETVEQGVYVARIQYDDGAFDLAEGRVDSGELTYLQGPFRMPGGPLKAQAKAIRDYYGRQQLSIKDQVDAWKNAPKLMQERTQEEFGSEGTIDRLFEPREE